MAAGALVGGLLVLGPALQPGALFALDLVVADRMDLPPGVWGLGPEYGRALPLTAMVALAGEVFGAANVVRLLFVVAFIVAAIGTARLVGRAPAIVRVGAGLLYAFSPFLLTRVGAGQISLVCAAAILPWAVPVLLRPHDDLARTYRWSLLLGLSGVAGGVFVIALLVTGMVAARGRRLVTVGFAGIVSQLPWLVPGILVMAQSPGVTPSSWFPTRIDGIGGVFALAVGDGFFQPAARVGGDSIILPVVGLAVVGLAAVGWRSLDATWGRRAGALAVVTMLVVVWSGTPSLAGSFETFVSAPLGGVVREAQRLLPLVLVFVVPAAAAGVQAVGRRLSSGAAVGALEALPAAFAVLVIWPGLWGVDGRLTSNPVPTDWVAAHELLSAEPGTTLALPWARYLNLSMADGNRTFNPASRLLPGDVLGPSDLGIGAGVREAADPREGPAEKIVLDVLEGRPVGPALAGLGVRWVALEHEPTSERYRSVATDPGLERVILGSQVSIFRVKDWVGPVVASDGSPGSVDLLVPPLARIEPRRSGTWARPGGWGWLRGTSTVATTERGLADLPPGGPLVWYWPASLVMSGYLVTLAGLVVVGRFGRARAVEP